jgi:hypothetical protein
VSGRIVMTTIAFSVMAPLRVSAVVQSPSRIPSFSASLGCISIRGSGYCCTNGPIRRVWVPDRNWRDDATRGKEDGILLAGIVDGRPVFGDVETSLAIGKVKGSIPFSHRIVAAALKQSGRT